MGVNEAKTAILENRTALGIEFGSTRIKAVLVDDKNQPIASGAYEWENQYVDGIWTYSLEEIWKGLQGSYQDMAEDVQKKYGVELTSVGAFGVSAMMHGYMPFNKEGELMVPFRTWRNNITGEASEKLAELFHYNIPQRWSIAHLYQAILNGEEHVKDIDYITTLEAYVHWKLTGKRVLGIGDAAGMFPIDSETKDYNEEMVQKFDELVAPYGFPWKLRDIMPKALVAGQDAGVLTEEGAKLLDVSGTLKAGIPMCPPEGDAGTGMVATNSVTIKTGNVSAGTSIFSMIVLEKQLSKVYEEIDMVTTPAGKPVAMVHCNNCCTDLDYWVNLFADFAGKSGSNLTKPQIYDLLYNTALDGDSDCGGVVNFNYFSGEPVSHTEDGRPMFLRSQNCNFNLPNFMRAQIYSTIATLKLGMEILENENAKIDCLMGHGGLFKTDYVGQRFMAGAMNTPVTVTKTAGEGGAWGMAVLAAYSVCDSKLPLDEYLRDFVFADCESTTVEPVASDVEGFNKYMKLYKSALEVEKSAYKNI